MLREQIKAEVREIKEDAELLKNNFHIISLIFPNDDPLFFNEFNGINYI